MPRGVNSHRDAQQSAHQNGGAGQQGRIAQAAHNDRNDWRFIPNAVTQVPPKGTAQPLDVLQGQRVVGAQLLQLRFDLFRRNIR